MPLLRLFSKGSKKNLQVFLSAVVTLAAFMKNLTECSTGSRSCFTSVSFNASLPNVFILNARCLKSLVYPKWSLKPLFFILHAANRSE